MSPLIVVIDDDEAVRAMFVLLAQHEDWTVFDYSYAEFDLVTIQKLNPDLIVLDFIKEQIGEGWKFLQLLKMEESTAAIPIVISTPILVLPAEIKGYLASRDIQVISRPFDLEEFIPIIRQIIMRQSLLFLPMTKKLPILLVEDNVDLSSIFMEILEMEGYLATTVPNGQLALDAVRQGRYSLIFLDMDMPVMTGSEFVAVYVREPEPHTPIIVFTAHDVDLYEFPSFVIGQMPKAFTISELLVFVSKFALPA